MKQLILTTCTLFCVLVLNAQSTHPEIDLYEGEIPNSIATPNVERFYTKKIFAVEKVSRPTLTIYLPEKQKATGAAVVICPGGGYSVEAIQHEGYDIAQCFADNGVTAFVLKYRIPDSTTSPQPSIVPVQDAQQALLTVRRNSAKWNIDPNKVGIIGFSAGGHLASTAATHFTTAYNPANKGENLRPDFAILIYPVISADTSIAHRGSFAKLLGVNASQDERLAFSNEKHITAETPPSFLVHAADDKVVPVQNSLRFAELLIANKVPVEMHIFPKGGHGFGLNLPNSKTKWFDFCINWMESQGF